jgi:hypothetical protein
MLESNKYRKKDTQSEGCRPEHWSDIKSHKLEHPSSGRSMQLRGFHADASHLLPS